jgi:hypothetical protein
VASINATEGAGNKKGAGNKEITLFVSVLSSPLRVTRCIFNKWRITAVMLVLLLLITLYKRFTDKQRLHNQCLLNLGVLKARNSILYYQIFEIFDWWRLLINCLIIKYLFLWIISSSKPRAYKVLLKLLSIISRTARVSVPRVVLRLLSLLKSKLIASIAAR